MNGLLSIMKKTKFIGVSKKAMADLIDSKRGHDLQKRVKGLLDLEFSGGLIKRASGARILEKVLKIGHRIRQKVLNSGLRRKITIDLHKFSETFTREVLRGFKPKEILATQMNVKRKVTDERIFLKSDIFSRSEISAVCV